MRSAAFFIGWEKIVVYFTSTFLPLMMYRPF